MFIPNIPETANEELRKVIEELIYISKMADTTGEIDLRFTFNNPATEDEIIEFEKEIDVSFTDDYKDFLRFSNGSNLCSYKALFYNLHEMISIEKKGKVSDFPKGYVIIGGLIGDGEVVCFDKKTKKYVRFFDGSETEFNSFTDFLVDFVTFIKETVEDYVDLKKTKEN